MDHVEKRREKRLYITFDVRFDMSSHQQWVSSSAKNISINGMCLLTKEHIPLGTLLFIEFFIPDEDTTIQITGEVVWNGEHKVSDSLYFENGITFIEIQSKYKDLIGKYIEGATFEKK